MAFEIELKVRLNDLGPVKERLAAIGIFCQSFEKSDTYWIPGGADYQSHKRLPPPDIRVRREISVDAEGKTRLSALVTYKTKVINNGIEVNDEREFTVSCAEIFEDMLERLGLRPHIHKVKQGWAWTIAAENQEEPSVLAELSLVKNLGFFLELEILAADNTARTVGSSQSRLLSLLARLEIDASQIEERPYTELLREIDPAGTRALQQNIER
ncbi:MAG: class IV adenylate cyclase [Treponema sp.]|nr:class IV adenylate cyclase [Treponema sp.]